MAAKTKSPKRKPETRPSINLVEMMEKYGSEDRCFEALEELRWPDGIKCPRCECERITRIDDRRQFHCNGCQYQFSVKSGTILHDSHLPLFKWFLAVYMMCESKKGISANQLKRTIGVSYKTAWYLCHRIREAMAKANKERAPLDDTVEVDESFVGGKTKGRGHGYKGNKTAVAVAVERDGDARLDVIPDRSAATLCEFLKKHAEDADNIFSDDWPGYRGLATETVNHSIEEWVRGQVHTNTAESVWSLLKRSIIGAFHHVSEKHLDRYLDELEWRFSNRHNSHLFQDTLITLLFPGNMEYEKLIS